MSGNEVLLASCCSVCCVNLFCGEDGQIVKDEN